MLSSPRMSRRSTTPIAAFASGNRLFEAAVAALGLNDTFARRLLGQIFSHVGSKTDEVSADELGLLFPEVERRLLLALPFETAAPAIARLRQLLLAWDD